MLARMNSIPDNAPDLAVLEVSLREGSFCHCVDVEGPLFLMPQGFRQCGVIRRHATTISP